MDGAPRSPRPSAIPSHLTNGSSPLHTSQQARDTQERENARASIQSSMGTRKVPLDLKDLSLLPGQDGQNSQKAPDHKVQSRTSNLEKEHARDPRDEAAPETPPITSRSTSPFTHRSTVDFDGLSWPSAGTLDRLDSTPEQAVARIEKLTGAIRTVLECVGEDPDREGLYGTPERYAKAMMFFTKGYETNLRDIVNGAVFSEDHDELVIVKDIDIYSLCEHHLVPFTGKVCTIVLTARIRVATSHTDHSVDAHWIHPKQACTWSFQICSHCRDVCTPPASSGTIDKTSSIGHIGGLEAAGRGRRHGIEPLVHGHAGCRKNVFLDDHELYAWSHEKHCQDQGGVSQPSE